MDRDAPALIIRDRVIGQRRSIVAEQVAFAADPKRPARILKHCSHDAANLRSWTNVDDERRSARLHILRARRLHSIRCRWRLIES
jgi:hypothetical protein